MASSMARKAESIRTSVDPHHRHILQALDGELDPETFEACAAALLSEIYPGLVPVRGGGDDGFDGAIPTGSGEPMPLVSTTSPKATSNLRKNLKSALDKEWPITRAIFATPRKVSPRVRKSLFKCAREFGVELHQVHEQEFFARALYGNSAWCRRLLDVTGRAPALSRHPPSMRLLPGDSLVGREEDLSWLMDSSGDCLLFGGPGIGKTALLEQLAASGDALFLADSDRAAIADAIRDLDPSTVIVDDAHVDPGRATELAHVRREVGARFRILAASWPAGSRAVATAMSLAEHRIRELELMDADSIVEVIKSTGLTGPVPLQALIRHQAGGRPGLAVTLTRLALEGDVSSVVSGESLLRELEPALERMLGGSSVRLLAPFALSGETGITPTDAAKHLGLSCMEVSEKLAHLAAAGIVRESRSGAVSVHPAPLRWILVRDVFSRGPVTVPYGPLLESFGNLEEAVVTMLGACARGATFPDLLSWVERVGRQRVWAEFASLGPHEAALVLERTEERSIDTVGAALDKLPERSIELLLELAENDSREPRQASDRALRRLEAWAVHVSPDRVDVVGRRAKISRVTERWWRRTGGAGTALRALRIALNPGFELSEADPGRGMTITRRWGRLRDRELEEVSTTWPIVMAIVESDVARARWDDIDSILDGWAHPAEPPTLSDDTRRLMRQVVSRMLNDLGRSLSSRPGIQRRLRVYAGRLGIPWAMESDEVFETLFPMWRRPEDAGDRRPFDSVPEPLVKTWRDSAPEELAAFLARMEHEAEAASITYPRTLPVLCRRLAQVRDDHMEVTRAFATAELRADLLEPFVDRSAAVAPTDRNLLLTELLDAPKYHALGVRSVLLAPSPPGELLEKALDRAPLVCHEVRKACRHHNISREMIRTLLAHPSATVAVEAAIGLWEAEGGNAKAIMHDYLWRDSVLRSAETCDDSSRDFLLGVLLKEDEELARDWLIRRVGSTNGAFILREDQISLDVAATLGRENREAVLRSVGANCDVPRIVCALIGDDVGLYQLVLGTDAPDRICLSPLEGPIDARWRTKVIAALDHGYDTAAIATMTAWSTDLSTSAETEIWSERRRSYKPFLDDVDERLVDISRRAIGMVKERLKIAEDRERHERIYGSW